MPEQVQRLEQPQQVRVGCFDLMPGHQEPLRALDPSTASEMALGTSKTSLQHAISSTPEPAPRSPETPLEAVYACWRMFGCLGVPSKFGVEQAVVSLAAILVSENVQCWFSVCQVNPTRFDAHVLTLGGALFRR